MRLLVVPPVGTRERVRSLGNKRQSCVGARRRRSAAATGTEGERWLAQAGGTRSPPATPWPRAPPDGHELLWTTGAGRAILNSRKRSGAGRRNLVPRRDTSSFTLPGNVMESDELRELIRRTRAGEQQAAAQILREFEPALRREARI